MRKVVGLLALFLGGAGVLVFAAGVVAVRRLEGAVVERTDRATACAAESLAHVELLCLLGWGRKRLRLVPAAPVG